MNERRARDRGQALLEYALLIGLLTAALCLPFAEGESAIVRLERALATFWSAYRTLVFQA